MRQPGRNYPTDPLPPPGCHVTVEGRQKSVTAVVDTSPGHGFKTKRGVSKELYVISVVFLLFHTHVENVNSGGYFWRQRFEGDFHVSLYTFSSYLNIFQ